MTVLSTCHALAIARFKRYKRRILTTKKHAHNKSIAVLKNTDQNGRYVAHIQLIIEKESNSHDSPSRIATFPACITDGEKREPAFLIA